MIRASDEMVTAAGTVMTVTRRYSLYRRAAGAILAVTFRRFLPYCGVVALYCTNVQQSKEFSCVDQCEHIVCLGLLSIFMIQDWQLFQGLPID